MATYLYRLGGWAFDNRRKVLSAGWWCSLLVIASAAAFSGQFSTKFEVPGTESQQAQDLLTRSIRAPAAPRRASSTPLRRARSSPTRRTRPRSWSRRNGPARPRTSSQVVDPYKAKAISKDGRIGYADVIYPMPPTRSTTRPRDELEASAEPAEAAGMQVEFGGGLVDRGARGQLPRLLGIMVGFLVLAITLGSLVAAGCRC